MAALPVQVQGRHQLVAELAQVASIGPGKAPEVNPPGDIVMGQLALPGGGESIALR
jgi:hypothetical protein